MFTDSENEFYHFNKPYLDKVDISKTVVENLQDSFDEALPIFKEIPVEKHLYRYAENKWTIKELLEHIIDAERVFAYRALRIARKDTTDLPGFDENEYVANANSNTRNYERLLEELITVRKSTEILFANFNENVLLQKGTVDGKIISVRVLGYVISGHLRHHLRIIKERYLQ